MSNRKTITVGRVKGSMVYSGTDFQVENPLENDLYLQVEEYAFYQYKNGNWVKIADLEEHSLETEGVKISTSDKYDIKSEDEIPTSKAVNKIFNERIDTIIGEGGGETLETINEVSKALNENKELLDVLTTKSEIESLKEQLNRIQTYGYIYSTNPYVIEKTLYLDSVNVEGNTLEIKESRASVKDDTLYL